MHQRCWRAGAAAGPLSDAAALVLRLLLVHAYRGVLLRDPRLNLRAGHTVPQRLPHRG